MSRAFAITAIGLVSAAGDEPSRIADALPAAIGAATAPIEGFDVNAYVQRKGMRHLSRTSQLACAAAARLAPALEGVRREDVGVVLGSRWAALDTIVRFEREAWTEGPRFVDPLLFTETVPNVPAGQVSIVFGWSALNMTLGGGDTAGLEAVTRGIDLLDEGRARVMVAGGVDALHEHVVRTLEARGSAAERPRPCGEASCLLAIEPLDAARARGVTPLGRIAVANGEPVDFVFDADTDLPARLGRTWAASGPLAIAIALGGPSAHGVVLVRGGGDPASQLTAVRLALDAER